MSNQNDDSSNQRQRFNSSNNNNNNNYTNNPRFQQRPNTYRNKHQSTEPEYNSYRNNNNNNKSYQKQRNSQQENLMNKQESTPLAQNNKLQQQQQQSSRLISVCSTTSSTTSINCICCLHELETYAYYLCQHFVCLKCAIKMRILCKKIDCPVCRQESKSVLCTKKPIELSTDNNNKTNLINELILNCPNYSRPIKLNPIPNCVITSSNEQQQYQDSLINTPNCGINFESDEIKEEYNQILSSKCDECGEWFREFDALDNHMRKVHRYFYCELCLENLKLFPYERKYYNREELAMHKRNGDKSGEFKGHPLCKYYSFDIYFIIII